jgi:hypothetical protein
LRVRVNLGFENAFFVPCLQNFLFRVFKKMIASVLILSALPLLLAVSATSEWPIFERDGKTAVMQSLAHWIDSHKQPPGSHYASPSNWADEIVYHIVVDRFNNGNSSNDGLNDAFFQTNDVNNGYYGNVGNFRQGGDLQGIIDRMDYIVSF